MNRGKRDINQEDKNMKISTELKKIDLPSIWTAKTYFWSGNGNGSERARKEAYYQSDVADFLRALGMTVNEGNTVKATAEGIEVNFSVDMSRNNVYVTKDVFVNGEKKTLAALKKWAKGQGFEIV